MVICNKMHTDQHTCTGALYTDTLWSESAFKYAETLVAELRTAAPDCNVYFIGALSLGLSGHNDVDLNVHCHTRDSEELLECARKVATVLGHEPTSVDEHLIQWVYVREGVEVDTILYDDLFEGVGDQIRIHEILAGNDVQRAEYARLKGAYDQRPLDEYSEAKKKFFKKILS